MRRIASQLPLPGPNRSIAVRAYWEQVGVNRQVGGNSGDKATKETGVGVGLNLALAVSTALADLDAGAEAAILASEVSGCGIEAEAAKKVERGEVRSIAEHGHSEKRKGETAP